MDILDVILSKGLTPQGQINTYAARAQKAVSDSNTVLSNAREAVENIDSITEQTQTNNDLALETLEKAEEALNKAEESSTDAETINNISNVANQAKNIAENAIADITIENDNTSIAKGKKIKVRKKNIENSYNIIKNYTTIGNNEDGSMTQKAITDELNKIKRESGGESSGITNLGTENDGKIVIVGSDGNIKASGVTEENIIESLISGGFYDAKDAVGLEIDYHNRSFTRIQGAAHIEQGSDFDKYIMYGGRRRCIVNSNGKIIAWYGDFNYVEDGSLGQVMVYQPKFYYNRAIIAYENNANGKVVNKESIIISATKQTGFKLHPMFKDENGEEIDYVLFPAYESTYNDVSANKIVLDDSASVDFTQDKLMSIAGAKPISGVNKQFTIDNAEKMAQNIGNGWHITNMAYESVNQMLEMIEFGQMNGQLALEAGIVNISNASTVNGASITGSTSSLGNSTGAAASTTNEISGKITEYNEPGYRAISYRGIENPWGNMYHFIGGVNLYSDGTMGSGMPYIASNYEYTPDTNGSNYHNIGYQIANNSDWISNMGYGDPDYDWVYLPITASGASSLTPVGDYIWTDNYLNGINMISIGGTQRQGDNCGPFYYGCDQKPNRYSASLSARIMHIPTKGSSVYEFNIASWRQQIGA